MRGLRNAVSVRVSRSGEIGHPLSNTQKARNRKWSSVRAFVEHPFHAIKRLWGFTKVRYRGLKENTVRVLPCWHWPTSTA